MISQIIKLGIFVLLSYAAIQDYKTGIVKNWIAGSIAILCIPLLTLNHFALPFQIGLAIFLFVAWNYNHFISCMVGFKDGFGGADVKAIIPLMFTLNDIQFFYFIAITFIGIIFMFHILILAKSTRRVPMFIAITVAYLMVII